MLNDDAILARRSSARAARGRLVKRIKLVGLAAMVLPLAVSAADLDGSKTLICAPMGAYHCKVVGGCEVMDREDMENRFLRIDFERKKISGAGLVQNDLNSDIDRLERTEEALILQGEEDGLAWSISIDRKDGDMGITVSGPEDGFVIFGACTFD